MCETKSKTNLDQPEMQPRHGKEIMRFIHLFSQILHICTLNVKSSSFYTLHSNLHQLGFEGPIYLASHYSENSYFKLICKNVFIR